MELSAKLRLCGAFKERLERLQAGDMRKAMDKLTSARLNLEEKRGKLARALNAHEGLLSSMVKIKGRQPQVVKATYEEDGVVA